MATKFLFATLLLILSACASEPVTETASRVPAAIDYCYLPQPFINPEIYAKYCQNAGQCLPAGARAGTLRSSCCSQQANTQGVCVGSQQAPALPNEFCENNFECLSGTCDVRFHRCMGAGLACSPTGSRCTETNDCCSGRCNNTVCLGSPASPMPIGGFCRFDHDECVTRYCNAQSHRCE